MILENVKNITKLMKDNKIRASSFEYCFKLSGKEFKFTCILRMQDSFSYDLYFAPRENYDFVISIDIDSNYEFSTYLDEKAYQKLSEFLKLKNKKNLKFSTTAFFEDFNNYLKTIKEINISNYKHILILNKSVIKDNHKIYFCGWRRNDEKDKVSNNIYDKMKIAFGKNFAEKMRELNISAKWTSNKNRENIKDLRKFYIE